MREGRIRPSLEWVGYSIPEYLDAAMREGRIRPSLKGRLTRPGRRREGRNEGGANSPLVVRDARDNDRFKSAPQ